MFFLERFRRRSSWVRREFGKNIDSADWCLLNKRFQFFLAIYFRLRVVGKGGDAMRGAFVIYVQEKIAILCSPIVRNYFWPDERFLSFSQKYGETVLTKMF